jgi:hypothetical protein
MVAGGDARPTGLFMIFGWAKWPMKDCPEKFLRICRTAAPGCPATGWKACATKTFHVLWVSRGLMFNCTLLTAHCPSVLDKLPAVL